jgi:prophage antirepressor-like protein
MTMTKLAIKLFGYDNAKTILTRTLNGKSWYMAFDVCNLVGIKNYSAAVNKKHKNATYTLASSEHQLKTEYTGTSRKSILLVNDKGMLKLIMQSDPACTGEIQARALEVFKLL